ncbi:MAG: phospho-N-acetylmuramoyl-pentapeptide-transferase [Clostridia bacterium]|nr:phospho-N-acetylmuramoyl-pentapeptide-transferase [Clostridia bacterium]
MLKPVLAIVLSVIAMLLIGPRFLPVLRRMKFGQSIYELGPQSHQVKQGTPTMGGLMFTVVSCVFALVLHGAWFGWQDFTLAVLFIALLSMLVGFVDDYIKVVKKRNLGLIWWQKIIGQVLTAFAFSLYCYLHPMVGSSIIVPFFNVEWNLGIFYVPLMTLVIIFMVNSANLQDGLDGILSSVTTVGGLAWFVMTLLVAAAVPAENAENYRNLAIFIAALVGGCIGFLRFNRYPAMVFMGDTGSMFIGGATVGIAMLLRMPLFMLLISFTLVASSLSVIIQRVYFKLTHGKRIFKMSPIHHHFELCGMSEKKIVAMYAVVVAVLSLIAVLTIKL